MDPLLFSNMSRTFATNLSYALHQTECVYKDAMLAHHTEQGTLDSADVLLRETTDWKNEIQVLARKAEDHERKAAQLQKLADSNVNTLSRSLSLFEEQQQAAQNTLDQAMRHLSQGHMSLAYDQVQVATAATAQATTIKLQEASRRETIHCMEANADEHRFAASELQRKNNFNKVMLGHAQAMLEAALSHTSDQRLSAFVPVPSARAIRAHVDFSAGLLQDVPEALQQAISKRKQAGMKKEVKYLAAKLQIVAYLRCVEEWFGLRPSNPTGCPTPMSQASSTAIFDSPILPIVFISIDLEWLDHNPCGELQASKGHITQVGLATLSTETMKLRAPGEGGQDWKNMVSATLLVVDEYKHIQNKYSKPSSEAREFGAERTSVISVQDLKITLKKVINKASCQGKYQVVLVGHDVQQDKRKVIEKLELDLEQMPTYLATVDTQALYTGYTFEMDIQNGAYMASDKIQPLVNYSLKDMASALFACEEFSHCAGWDALMTLHALIAMVVSSTSRRNSSHWLQCL